MSLRQNARRGFKDRGGGGRVTDLHGWARPNSPSSIPITSRNDAVCRSNRYNSTAFAINTHPKRRLAGETNKSLAPAYRPAQYASLGLAASENYTTEGAQTYLTNSRGNSTRNNVSTISQRSRGISKSNARLKSDKSLLSANQGLLGSRPKLSSRQVSVHKCNRPNQNIRRPVRSNSSLNKTSSLSLAGSKSEKNSLTANDRLTSGYHISRFSSAKSYGFNDYNSYSFSDLNTKYDFNSSINEQNKIENSQVVKVKRTVDNIKSTINTTEDMKLGLNLNSNFTSSFRSRTFKRHEKDYGLYNKRAKLNAQSKPLTMSNDYWDFVDNSDPVDMDLCDTVGDTADSAGQIADITDAVQYTEWVPLHDSAAGHSHPLDYLDWDTRLVSSTSAPISHQTVAITTYSGSAYSDATTSHPVNNYVNSIYNSNSIVSCNSINSTASNFGIYSVGSGLGLNSTSPSYGVSSIPTIPQSSYRLSHHLQQQQPQQQKREQQQLPQKQQLQQPMNLADLFNTFCLQHGINPMMLATSGADLSSLTSALPQSVTNQNTTVSTSSSQIKSSESRISRKRTISDNSVHQPDFRSRARRRSRSLEREGSRQRGRSHHSQSRSRHRSRSALQSAKRDTEPSDKRPPARRRNPGYCVYLNRRNRHLVDQKETPATYTRRHTLSTGDDGGKETRTSSSPTGRRSGNKNTCSPTDLTRQTSQRSKSKDGSISSAPSSSRRPRIGSDGRKLEGGRVSKPTRWMPKEDDDRNQKSLIESSADFMQDIIRVVMDQSQWELNPSFNRDPVRALAGADKEIANALKELIPWASWTQIARSIPILHTMCPGQHQLSDSRKDRPYAGQYDRVDPASGVISPITRYVTTKLERSGQQSRAISSSGEKAISPRSTTQNQQSLKSSMRHRRLPPTRGVQASRRNRSGMSRTDSSTRYRRGGETDRLADAVRSNGLLGSRAAQVSRKYRDYSRNSVARSTGNANQKLMPVQYAHPNTLLSSNKRRQADTSSRMHQKDLGSSNSGSALKCVDTYQTEVRGSAGQVPPDPLFSSSIQPRGGTTRRTLLATPPTDNKFNRTNAMSPENVSLNINISQGVRFRRSPLLPLPAGIHKEADENKSSNRSQMPIMNTQNLNSPTNFRNSLSPNKSDSPSLRAGCSTTPKASKKPLLAIPRSEIVPSDIVDLTQECIDETSVDRTLSNDLPRRNEPLQGSGMIPSSDYTPKPSTTRTGGANQCCSTKNENTNTSNALSMPNNSALNKSSKEMPKNQSDVNNNDLQSREVQLIVESNTYSAVEKHPAIVPAKQCSTEIREPLIDKVMAMCDAAPLDGVHKNNNAIEKSTSFNHTGKQNCADDEQRLKSSATTSRCAAVCSRDTGESKSEVYTTPHEGETVSNKDKVSEGNNCSLALSQSDCRTDIESKTKSSQARQSKLAQVVNSEVSRTSKLNSELRSVAKIIKEVDKLDTGMLTGTAAIHGDQNVAREGQQTVQPKGSTGSTVSVTSKDASVEPDKSDCVIVSETKEYKEKCIPVRPSVSPSNCEPLQRKEYPSNVTPKQSASVSSAASQLVKTSPRNSNLKQNQTSTNTSMDYPKKVKSDFNLTTDKINKISEDSKVADGRYNSSDSLYAQNIPVQNLPQKLAQNDISKDLVSNIYPKNKTAYSKLMNSSRPLGKAENKPKNPLLPNPIPSKLNNDIPVSSSSAHKFNKKPLLSSSIYDSKTGTSPMSMSSCSRSPPLQATKTTEVKQPLLTSQPISSATSSSSLPSSSLSSSWPVPSETLGPGAHRGPLLAMPVPFSGPPPSMNTNNSALKILTGGLIPNGLLEAFRGDRTLLGSPSNNNQRQKFVRKGRR